MNARDAKAPAIEAVDSDQSGIACVVWRNPLGCLCGYAVVSSLPDYAGECLAQEARDGAVDGSCHGGVTYAEVCDEDRADEINLRWGATAFVLPGDVIIGFDCMHAGDWIPEPSALDGDGNLLVAGLGRDGHRWTVDEAMREARSLREALHALIRGRKDA